ncbi:MAG: hypothetical protein AAFY38_04175 [Pseudomonadota bacterium]
MRARAFAWAFALLMAVCPARAEEHARLTLQEARAMAQYALAQGDAALAWRLGAALLEADQNDAGAHFIMAGAAAQAGEAKAARQSAARAYRSSAAPADRLRAAQYAARAALEENRPTLTQIWLRRAATNASQDVDMRRIAHDYARVRRMNPWAIRIAGGVQPSNNVNNGADTALQVIDGVPVVGSLSGDAQALSGLVGTLDVKLSYRLSGSATSQTQLGGRVYVRQVALSSDAQAQAPNAQNGDFASTYAEAALTHTFALGAAGNAATLGAALGQAWSGGDHDYDFGRLFASRSVGLGKATRLSFNLSLEERHSAQLASQDQTITTLGTALSHTLSSGDKITLSYSLRDVDAGHINSRSTAHSLRLGYSFGRQIGPAQVTAALTLGDVHYPDFRVGFIEVPGGRQDQSVYADVTLFFPDIDYAGFAPALRIRTGSRNSNVSRYDSREFSVGLQIQSKF